MSDVDILLRFVYNTQIEKIDDKIGLLTSALYPYPNTDGISVQQFIDKCDELYCKKKALELKSIQEKQGFYGLGAIKTKIALELGLNISNSRSSNNPYHADILISQKYRPKHAPLPQKIIQVLDSLANKIKLFKDACPTNQEKWCGENIKESINTAN